MLNFASALFETEHQVTEVLQTLEALMREGDADDAMQRLDLALEALEEMDHPIAALCRDAALSRVDVIGWQEMQQQIARLNTRQSDGSAPITAISIDISVHGDVLPGQQDSVEPFIETNFYTDAAFPFSTATRVDLMEAYSGAASKWQGCFVEIDNTISIAGLGNLNAELMKLEQSLRAGSNENPLDHDALFIGSAFMAVRLHQAVRESIIDWGLPYPMVLLVGSNESYPFFDAPVIASDEFGAEEAHDGADGAIQPALQTEAGEPLPRWLQDAEQAEEEQFAVVAEASDMEWPSEEATHDQDQSQWEVTAEHESEHLDEAETVEETAPEYASLITPQPQPQNEDDSQSSSVTTSFRKRIQENSVEPAEEEVSEAASQSGGMFSRLFRKRA